MKFEGYFWITHDMYIENFSRVFLICTACFFFWGGELAAFSVQMLSLLIVRTENVHVLK